MFDVASGVGKRLNVLAMCSIENDILDKIDLLKKLISVLLSKILCQEMPEDVFLKALKHYSFI
jgi:hypothetical protein